MGSHISKVWRDVKEYTSDSPVGKTPVMKRIVHDPRSPTILGEEGVGRTPIYCYEGHEKQDDSSFFNVFETDWEKIEMGLDAKAFQSGMDPRSPTIGIDRTPIVLDESEIRVEDGLVTEIATLDKLNLDSAAPELEKDIESPEDTEILASGSDSFVNEMCLASSPKPNVNIPRLSSTPNENSHRRRKLKPITVIAENLDSVANKPRTPLSTVQCKSPAMSEIYKPRKRLMMSASNNLARQVHKNSMKGKRDHLNENTRHGKIIVGKENH